MSNSDSPRRHPVLTKTRATIEADFKLEGKEGESKMRLSTLYVYYLSP